MFYGNYLILPTFIATNVPYISIFYQRLSFASSGAPPASTQVWDIPDIVTDWSLCEYTVYTSVKQTPQQLILRNKRCVIAAISSILTLALSLNIYSIVQFTLYT